MTIATARRNTTATRINQDRAQEPVVFLLRLEGAAAALAGLAAYLALAGPWWFLAATLLLPDLAMVGYAFGPKVGARLYNLVHTYTAPALLAASSLLLGPWLVSFACIWVVHIGLDRALGYGLKLESGFHYTHLGQIVSQGR